MSAGGPQSGKELILTVRCQSSLKSSSVDDEEPRLLLTARILPGQWLALFLPTQISVGACAPRGDESSKGPSPCR